MSVEIEVLGWKAIGFRCPDHEVSFLREDDTVFPVTLIQMPNGTGKTTTLALLRAALGGTAASVGNAIDIQDLRKRDLETPSGQFEVRLRYRVSGLAAKRLTIQVLFDFDLAELRYQTTFGSGINNEFKAPTDLRPFLKDSFVPFFVFDGELAERLMDRTKTDATEVIDSLFELRSLDTVKDRVDKFWQEKVRQIGATDGKGLTQRRNRFSEADRRLAYLHDEHRRCADELSAVLQQLDVQRRRFADALASRKEAKERYDDAQNKLRVSGTGVQNLAKDVLRQMRNPASISATFAVRMLELKGHLDTAKLPETAAREFFEELSQEAECVCGRPLDADSREALLDRAKLYLGSDETGLLNSMKESISTSVGTTTSESADRVKNSLALLVGKLRETQLLQTELDLVNDESIAGNPELEKADADIRRLDDRSRTLRTNMEKFDSPDEASGDQATFGIAVMERRRETARRKLAEVTATIRVRQQSDLLQAILRRARRIAQDRIIEDVVKQANTRLTQLLPDNRLRIASIRGSLILDGQRGGSVGENLTIAYGFLSSLFNNTQHQLPFIVDSPAGAIDLDVRARVAELIPSLTSQFIAFTISSERVGFVGPLGQQVNAGAIQYLTLFRRGNDGRDQRAMSLDLLSEMSDGICVTGREYFESFQDEDN